MKAFKNKFQDLKKNFTKPQKMKNKLMEVFDMKNENILQGGEQR